MWEGGRDSKGSKNFGLSITRLLLSGDIVTKWCGSTYQKTLLKHIRSNWVSSRICCVFLPTGQIFTKRRPTEAEPDKIELPGRVGKESRLPNSTRFSDSVPSIEFAGKTNNILG